MSSEKIPVLAYFFPQDERDPSRLKRSKLLGASLQSDLELSRQRGINYCILNPLVTEWNDSNPEAIDEQVSLAKNFGLDGFIVDAYVGRQNNGDVEELGKSLDLIADSSKGQSFSFCPMFCLKLSRSELPIRQDREEPNRWLDLSKETAERIVDRAAGLWFRPGYFYLGIKPYMSVYGLLKHPHATDENSAAFIGSLREYALKKYKTDLHLVGIGQTPRDFLRLHKFGFDQITSYAGLPDFESIPEIPEVNQFAIKTPYTDIQEYDRQLRSQIDRWLGLIKMGVDNYIPSVTVGWDAGRRGEMVDSADKSGYPYYPVVAGGSPETLLKALKQVYAFLLYARGNNPYIAIFAWNEFGENAALMPRVDTEGKRDTSYLQVVQDFSRFLEMFSLPIIRNV